MIVLANEEFATGLRLAGVKSSYTITGKAQAENIIKGIPRHEFIIATQKVVEITPKLEEFPNLVVFPDTIKGFSKIDDLKKITKAAIGSEVEI